MDTNNGQNKPDENTGAPVPSAEKPAEETQQPTLPDEVKARTAAEFEKLKEHNRTLAEENRVLKGRNPSPTSVYDDLRPNTPVAALPSTPFAGFQQPVSQPIVDEGGFIDATVLNSTLSAAQRKAEEARQIALQNQTQIRNYQEAQTVKAVHLQYPEVDPKSDTFDPDFYEYVKNEMIGQMMKGQEDFEAAAAKARKVLGRKTAEAPQARKDTISSRQQASAPTGASSVNQTTDQVKADLVKGSYKGDKNAIYQRLKASGY